MCIYCPSHLNEPPQLVVVTTIKAHDKDKAQRTTKKMLRGWNPFGEVECSVRNLSKDGRRDAMLIPITD